MKPYYQHLYVKGLAMHEALELKINELIDNGEEHKVQWGKLLETFSGLELNRIVICLESLTPSQLDSISDGIQRARDRANYRSLEAVKANLLKQGIKISDFLSHLGIQLDENTVSRLDKPTAESRPRGNRLSANGKKLLEELLLSGKYSASKAVEKVFLQTGEKCTAATAYATRAKLRKEGKMT